MENIAHFENINSLNIDVKKEIEATNIKEFIYSFLDLNNISYSNDDSIFYNYLDESNKYQVFVVNKKYKYLLFEVFKAKYLDDKKDSIDLFITKEFFVVFKNQSLYYFQAINYDVYEDELKLYIKKNLNLDIQRVFYIDMNELLELKTIYVKNFSKSDLKPLCDESSFSLKYFLLYIILLFSLLISYMFYSNAQEEKRFLQQKEDISTYEIKQKNKYKYFPSLLTIVELDKKIKKYKLDLIYASFKKKKLNLTVVSTKKENIYSFLSLYKSSLINNSITFNEKNKTYECNANIKVSR